MPPRRRRQLASPESEDPSPGRAGHAHTSALAARGRGDGDGSGGSGEGGGAGEFDEVDQIADAWLRERPGTPVASVGVVTRLWHAAKLLGDDRRRTLAQAGADPATLDLLAVLRRSGPPYRLSTRELARRTLVTAGAISQRLTRAEREKLVTRSPGEDARAVDVTLTAAGHELVEALVDRVLSREAALLGVLDAHEQAVLAALLRKLVAGLHEELGPSRPGHVGGT